MIIYLLLFFCWPLLVKTPLSCFCSLVFFFVFLFVSSSSLSALFCFVRIRRFPLLESPLTVPSLVNSWRFRASPFFCFRFYANCSPLVMRSTLLSRTDSSWRPTIFVCSDPFPLFGIELLSFCTHQRWGEEIPNLFTLTPVFPSPVYCFSVFHLGRSDWVLPSRKR